MSSWQKLVVVLLLSCLSGRAQLWQELNSSAIDANISAFYYDQTTDLLLVGGSFSSIDGIANTRGIAAWDGQTWTAVANSECPAGIVNAIVRFRDTLFVAGDGLFRLNGSEWDTLTPYLDGSISDLVEFQGALYVCGDFWSDPAAAEQARGVGVYGKPDWQALNENILGEPTGPSSICAFQDEIYVGGEFFSTFNMPLTNTAAYNGTQWYRPWNANMFFEPFKDMAVFGDELFVAGHQGRYNNRFINNIARWDGQQWRDVAGGLFSNSTDPAEPGVSTLLPHFEYLYAAGPFDRAGADSITAEYLAAWDGQRWCSYDNPQGIEPYLLGTYQDSIICAYKVTSGVHRIAKLSPPATGFDRCSNGWTLGEGNMAEVQSISIRPNPVSERLFVDGLSIATRYQIADLTGKVVEQGMINPGDPISCEQLHAGLYMITVKGLDRSQTLKVVVR